MKLGTFGVLAVLIILLNFAIWAAVIAGGIWLGVYVLRALGVAI